MRNTKKAFTLVELIVVITILAILGTIAFISLQGYSSDARNSKRTQDISSIISKMSIQITKGVSLLSFVSDDSSALTPSPNFAGTGTTTADYNAGKVNYLALDMKASEFQDPTGADYVIGVTTKAEGKYQVAGTKESGGGAGVAVIKGSFIKRDDSDIDIDSSQTGSKVTISDHNNANRIKVNDYITLGASGLTAKVTKVSDNGKIVTIEGTDTITGPNVGQTTIKLAATDEDSLIGTVGSLGTAISNDGTNLPYKIN